MGGGVGRFIEKLARVFGIGKGEKGRLPQRVDRLEGYDLEEEAREKIRLVSANTMVSYSRLVTLYQQAVYCEESGIEGSFVECGTWKGGAVGLMVLANLEHGAGRRHLHLFDSFEGIPEPDAVVDGERAVKEVASVGGKAEGKLAVVERFYETHAGGVGTLEANRNLLENEIGYDSSFLHYHKGWFQETLPRDAAGIGGIAILRLDGDWYDSTKVCLEHLYGKVVPGGFVVVDDYGYYEGCRMAVDEFRKREGIRAFLHHIDAAGRYWIKP
jgi:O-methyltransferase